MLKVLWQIGFPEMLKPMSTEILQSDTATGKGGQLTTGKRNGEDWAIRDPNVSNPLSSAGTKIRRRFRVPYPASIHWNYYHLNLFKKKGWTYSQTNSNWVQSPDVIEALVAATSSVSFLSFSSGFVVIEFQIRVAANFNWFSVELLEDKAALASPFSMMTLMKSRTVAWITRIFSSASSSSPSSTSDPAKSCCVGADIHRSIRTSVRILIWQDYWHGYASTCTARRISRTSASDTLIRTPSRPFDSRSTLHLTGMFRDSRPNTKLHDDSQSRANWPSLCPPQRERCANKTRILLVFLSWEFPQSTIQERQLWIVTLFGCSSSLFIHSLYFYTKP